MPASRARRSSPSLTTSAPAPSAREQPQHRQPVIRLHRVMDVCVQPGIGQRSGEHAITPAHGGCRIHPGRRADGIGDGIQRHIVHQQPVHRVHGQMRPRRDQLGGGGIRGVDHGNSGHGVSAYTRSKAGPYSRPGDRLKADRAVIASSHRPVADPPWMKPALTVPALTVPALTVMAGLVPAIRSGRVPRPMAGTSPAMTMKVTPQRPGFLVRSERRGNLHRSAQRDGDCFAPLAMTGKQPNARWGDC